MFYVKLEAVFILAVLVIVFFHNLMQSLMDTEQPAYRWLFYFGAYATNLCLLCIVGTIFRIVFPWPKQIITYIKNGRSTRSTAGRNNTTNGTS